MYYKDIFEIYYRKVTDMGEKSTDKTSEKKKKFKWWKIPIFIILLAILVAGGYVAYVFLSYSRIEDNLALTPAGNATEKAKTGEEYTIVTYNLGFGAYTADFTFFMDEGNLIVST